MTLDYENGFVPIADEDLTNLDRAVSAAHELGRMKAALHYFVAKAHEDGHTWAQIGAALGMTGEGARRMFNREKAKAAPKKPRLPVGAGGVRVKRAVA